MKSISRRKFLKSICSTGAIAGLSSLSSLFQNQCSSFKHPNLVFVFPDQMRGQALGFLEEEPVITPNLDKFSKESIVFTQAISNYPVCSPFRGMLMTGQYPHSNGVLENCHSKSAAYGNELKTDSYTWSDLLKSKGYSLGYIGKWHLDAPRKPFVKSFNNRENFAWNEWCPPKRRHGFDYWYAYGTFDRHMNPMYWKGDAGRDGAHRIAKWGPEHEADKAVEYIKNNGGKYRRENRPFALIVSMNPPHMPYSHFPPGYLKAYKNIPDKVLFNRPNIPPESTKWGDYYRKNIRNYYAMITGVDKQFGRIIKSLKDSGLEKNTIVIFASDHGNCLGIHNKVSKNNYYEESMRIPFIIRWTGKIKPRKDELLISTPDIYPTLMDIMGFSTDCPDNIEGVSHGGVILKNQGLRPTSQLYIKVPLGKPSYGKRGIRTIRHTLILDKVPETPLKKIFFDRKNDPFQMTNLAESPNSSIEKKINSLIEKELKPWLTKTQDPWQKWLAEI